MLNKVGVGNFKAFAGAQHIPIRPLTLIYGANSSGKSSILHGLIFARHAMETGELDVSRTNIGGEAVDLGGFRQYIHRRNTDSRLYFEWQISSASFRGRLKDLLPFIENASISLSIGLSKFDKSTLDAVGEITPRKLAAILIDKAKEKGDTALASKLEEAYSENEDFFTFEELSKIEGDVRVESCKVDLNGQQFLAMSYRLGEKLQLDLLDTNHEVTKYIIISLIQALSTTDTVSTDELKSMSEVVDDLVPQMAFRLKKLFPIELLKEEESETKPQNLGLFAISKDNRVEDLAKVIKHHMPVIVQDIIKGLSEIIQTEYGKLKYLGPLRSYPPRHTGFDEGTDFNYGPGGGAAWAILQRQPSIRRAVNEWLGSKEKLSTPYELKIRNLLTIADIEPGHLNMSEKIIKEFFDEWAEDSSMDIFGELEERIYSIPEKLQRMESLLSEIQELVLVDKRSNTVLSHRDVGIGISQVLPVLVYSYAYEDKIIAMEQPEIHLHPALQAELGDLFIESALGKNKNRFLIETHSEHLLLRIMRRIRETSAGKLPENSFPVHPDDVMVLFVEPEGKRSIIHEMPINDRGDLVKPWPGGFFEEDFQELF